MTATLEVGPVQRARLSAEVTLASRILVPSWPLETFIAVNPLGGLVDRPFSEAIAVAESALGARGTLDEVAFREAHAAGRITDSDLRLTLRRLRPDLIDGAPVSVGGASMSLEDLLVAELHNGEPGPAPLRTSLTRSERANTAVAAAVDAQTIKWCSAFLDAGQSAWPMPGRELGFHPAWRQLARRDRSLPSGVRERLREIPERPEDAALQALSSLGVGPDEHRAQFEAHLVSLPGWAAHVRWRGEHSTGIDLVDYLALRLTYEAVLLAEAGYDPDSRPAATPCPAAPTPGERAVTLARALGVGTIGAVELAPIEEALAGVTVDERRLLWLAAYEGHHRDALLESMARPADALAAARPEAQLVCCIDVRSEGLRRHLESLGPYETLGFAGFFAVAIRFSDVAGGASSALCPVLLAPTNDISELAAPGAQAMVDRNLAGRNALAGAEDGFHHAKDDVLGPFALAEASGWAAAPLAASKTLLAGPYGLLRGRLKRSAAPPAPTDLTVQEGFTLEERGLFGEVALTMMGLTEGFARLVVLCGHGSTTENNPYASSLDCGACGGNRGAPNARVACVILNEPAVRDHLATRGIHIPQDTWFIGAEHDTATDQVAIFDRHLIPETHREELESLAADLERAGEGLSVERGLILPGSRSGRPSRVIARRVRARSTDWAQVFPEWGLAGNAAFIVGPRAMTQGLDLQRRAFLHSYEAAVDVDAGALETILTAPLVVAQWINAQYYFSTVDPAVFGAGTKTVHNVVGGIGVMAGHDGDLQMGLPWQSVADGDRLVHEPMRLLAIVQAPLERIAAIVDRNTILQHFFNNGWVSLAAREGFEDVWQRHTPHGWEPWTTGEERER